MKTQKLPYVISLDVHLLLEKWAAQTGWRVPSAAFMRNLRVKWLHKLRTVLPTLTVVSESTLRTGLQQQCNASVVPCVTLESCYVQTPFGLQLNRTVNTAGRDTGTFARNGSAALRVQLRELKASCGTNISLVDDVIYSGELVSRLIRLLRNDGFTIHEVIAGIGIGNGVMKVLGEGVRVSCVQYYAEVIDQVCERDFFPRMPYSGRTLLGARNVGVPYILPFGKPEQWASVPPEKAKMFSAFCLRATYLLYHELCAINRRSPRNCDMPRQLMNLPAEGSIMDGFTQWFRQVAENGDLVSLQ